MEDNKKKFLKISVGFFLAFLMFIASLAMTGLFGLINGELNIKAISDPVFQSKVLLAGLINLLSMSSIVTYLLPEVPKKNKEVIKREDIMVEFNATIRQDMVEEFVIELNLERKKSVYLTKLEKERKKFIKKFKPSLSDRKLWHTGTLEQKQDNEYCVKMLDFEFRKSDQYISENLIYMDIKFPEINSSMLLSTNMASNYGLNYVHSKFEKSVWLSLKFFSKYVTSLALPVVWAAILIDGIKEPNIDFWLDFIARLIGMLTSMASGITIVENFVNNFTIPDLDFRISLGRRFSIWQSKRASK